MKRFYPHYYPNYYSEFACIKGDCRHSCCVGWEIDVDDETLQEYEMLDGTFGDRLRAAISYEGDPHFRLDAKERCPFLNVEGLCDVILTLGEDRLCDICREHPRFHNELPTRTESGLGLCCEAAARLILSMKEPMVLISDSKTDGMPEETDKILTLRDAVLHILQNRAKSISERISEMLHRCGAVFPKKTPAEWAALFLSLERLDDAWTLCLKTLSEMGEEPDFADLDACVPSAEQEREQLLVYFVYRYMANAADREDAAKIAAFAVAGDHLIRLIGASVLRKTGNLDFFARVELVRMFSCEIEYCEENVEAIKKFLRI